MLPLGGTSGSNSIVLRMEDKNQIPATSMAHTARDRVGKT